MIYCRYPIVARLRVCPWIGNSITRLGNCFFSVSASSSMCQFYGCNIITLSFVIAFLWAFCFEIIIFDRLGRLFFKRKCNFLILVFPFSRWRCIGFKILLFACLFRWEWPQLQRYGSCCAFKCSCSSIGLSSCRIVSFIFSFICALSSSPSFSAISLFPSPLKCASVG